MQKTNKSTELSIIESNRVIIDRFLEVKYNRQLSYIAIIVLFIPIVGGGILFAQGSRGWGPTLLIIGTFFMTLAIICFIVFIIKYYIYHYKYKIILRNNSNEVVEYLWYKLKTEKPNSPENVPGGTIVEVLKDIKTDMAIEVLKWIVKNYDDDFLQKEVEDFLNQC